MAQVKAGKLFVATLVTAPLSIALVGANAAPGACEDGKCPDGNYQCEKNGEKTCDCPPIGSVVGDLPSGSHQFQDDQGNTWTFLIP